MNKSYRFLALVTAVLLMVLANTAYATDIMPRADTEFISTATVLKSSKAVSFRATTYEVKDSISVTACWLEIKNSDGTWTTVCSLPVPSAVGTETISFSTSKDYSSYIGNGTYRVWATYTADGHSISRCSNERTF